MIGTTTSETSGLCGVRHLCAAAALAALFCAACTADDRASGPSTSDEDAVAPDTDAGADDGQPADVLDAKDASQDPGEGGGDDSDVDAMETEADGADAGFDDGPADARDDSEAADAGEIPDSGAGDAGTIGDDGICYYGDFDTDQVVEVACWTGSSGERHKVALGGLTGGHAVEGIARNAGGTRLVVAGRVSETAPSKLVAYRLDGTATPVVLATAPAADRRITRPSFSADGSTIAFLADLEVPGAVSLYVVASTGGSPRRLSPLPASAALDVVDFAWSGAPGTRSWLAYVGDVTEDGVQGLWTVDTSVAPPTPVEVASPAELAPDGDVQPGIQWDPSGRVYYRANLGEPPTWRVHSSDPWASDKRVVTELDGDGGPTSVQGFGLSRGGDRLAFSAAGSSDGVLQLWVMPANGLTTPTQISSAASQAAGTGVAGPALQLPLVWSAGDTLVACAADWPLAAADRADVFSVWAHASSLPDAGTRLLGAPQSVDRNVRELAFSRDGARLFVRGDLVTDGVFELYATDDLSTPEQDPLSRRIEETPPGGDVVGLESRR